MRSNNITLEDIFSNRELLREVVETSAAESLGSDSAGRNGVNVELQLVKSFNALAEREGFSERLLTQRQLQELANRDILNVMLDGSIIGGAELQRAVESEQRFEAVDLFLVRRDVEQDNNLLILEWASLKTAQLKTPKRKTVNEVGSYLTLFNDPEGEIANYFMGRGHNTCPEKQICQVYAIVIFRDERGVASNFTVINADLSPSQILEQFPHKLAGKNGLSRKKEISGQAYDEVRFVDRQAVTNKKATSFNRGVKMRFSTLMREPEGVTVLLRNESVETKEICLRYQELYGLGDLLG